MASSAPCVTLRPAASIRPYDERTDARSVDAVEKLCDAGPSGCVSLFTDLLGDPLCRVRHFVAYTMLIAEVRTSTVGDVEIVGMIRAGVKHVIRGPPLTSVSYLSEVNTKEVTDENVVAQFTPTAYILGLRVLPQYRRLGIGVELVKQIEAWCKEQGAEYTYIATEKDNVASVNLFTHKLGYFKFRTPAILVQPVYAGKKRAHPNVKIVEVSKQTAEYLYRSVFKEREFFPKDVDAVMKSKLHKGTWVAVWTDEKSSTVINMKTEKRVGEAVCSATSWAVLSVWKCNEIFRLEVKGAPFHTRTIVAAARFAGKLFNRVGTVPTPPNVFKPFGLQLLYGMHAHGATGSKLLRELCWFAHNLARKDGCAVVAAEVGSCDPLRACIPHWPSLSCDEDLWCIKRLHLPNSTCTATATSRSDDWSISPPPLSLFVDPRDF